MQARMEARQEFDYVRRAQAWLALRKQRPPVDWLDDPMPAPAFQQRARQLSHRPR
jgi:hypothetical protein